jgi:hypothetical protein
MWDAFSEYGRKYFCKTYTVLKYYGSFTDIFVIRYSVLFMF